MAAPPNKDIPMGSAASFDFYDMLNEQGDDNTKGTKQDARDMYRMGNKPVLKRNFHSVSILGLTCILLGTWPGVLSNSTYSLINGGRAGSIWTYLATWIFTFPVVASLAEMASMAPTAGGQYHWVSEFAPPRFQKSLSYVSGWLAALGWQTFIAALCYSMALDVLQMATTAHPSYSPEKWHITCFTILAALIALLFNIFATKRLPTFEGLVLIIYILAFFGILVPLWVLAPKTSTTEVFTKFANFGGWSSTGAACLVGQTAAAAALLGVDSAAHMAEEVKNASVAVPRMMMLTVLLNGAFGFVMLITYVYCIQNIETQILNDTSGFPYYEVFTAATGSPGAAIGMCVPFVIFEFAGTINAVMAASRQAWAFARDDGLPFPRWMMKLATIDGTPLPLNTMLASMVILVVIALLNLGGSEIFETIISLLTGAIGTTYIISIACILWRRLYGDPLPPAKWSLGRWGLPINVIALLYQIFTTVMSFFPIFAKVDAASMNWSIAVYAGVILICIINYVVYARKKYRGPVVRIVKDD